MPRILRSLLDFWTVCAILALLEQVFSIIFPKYHTKILLGDFNVKARKENIFKPTIASESLHQYSNDNSVRIVNFAT